MYKFKTKTGRLTTYALACGYVERRESAAKQLDLWHEGACFHVRLHDFSNGQRILWESFGRLADARRFFDATKRGFSL